MHYDFEAFEYAVIKRSVCKAKPYMSKYQSAENGSSRFNLIISKIDRIW